MKPVYAYIKHPKIAAIVENRYSFLSKQDAKNTLLDIRKRFITSKLNTEDEDTLIIWIKEYNVTKEESQKGFYGNYATIDIAPLKDKKWGFKVKKLEAKLSIHPMKRYDTSKQHPDWLHPILRKVESGYIYKTIEEAESDLQELQEQYPQRSIPARNALHIMIYGKKYKSGKGVKKFTLTIELNDKISESKGGYIITAKENTYKRKSDSTKEKSVNKKTISETKEKGYFTSKVLLKQNAKKSN